MKKNCETGEVADCVKGLVAAPSHLMDEAEEPETHHHVCLLGDDCVDRERVVCLIFSMQGVVIGCDTHVKTGEGTPVH